MNMGKHKNRSKRKRKGKCKNWGRRERRRI